MFKGQLIDTSTGSHLRHLARRAAFPVLEGQQVPGLRPRRRHHADARRRRRRELRRHGVRPPGPEAVVRHRRLHAATARRVIVQHRYDLWPLPLDGSAGAQPHERRRREERDALPLRAHRAGRSARRAPGGRRRRRRRRRRDARATIDLSKPITLSAYGEYTKKAGFYELAERPAEGARLRGRVVQHARCARRRREKYLFTRQTFVEFPDLRVSGPGFKDSKKITDANPQQAEYPVGPPHAVRLQEQGRPPAAGHPRAARRLQAGREAADDRDVLREELAEPAPLQRAVVPHRHGLVADARR